MSGQSNQKRNIKVHRGDRRERREKKLNNLCVLSDLVYLCQELFLMLFREAGKNIFKIALVTENVTLSNPGI